MDIRAILARRFDLSFRPLAWIAAFLLSLQFIASALSGSGLGFGALLAVSAALAAAAATGVSSHVGQVLSVSVGQALAVAGTSLAALAAFVFRLNWHLFDLICPTGLLGAVAQVSEGAFPATFLAFPDVAMNYHQGFMYLTGVLSYLSPLSPASALNLGYVLSFALILGMLAAYFISAGSRYYLVPLALVVLVSSVSSLPLIDLGWASYVNVAEYLTSNSWPLAVVGVMLLLFLLRRFAESRWAQASVAFVVLCLSTVNATVFGVAVVTGAAMLAAHFAAGLFRSKLPFIRENRWPIAAGILALAALWLVPRLIPSAFMVGASYEAPGYAIRLLEYGPIKYALNMARYVFLVGALAWFSLAYAAASLRRAGLALDRRALFVGLVVAVMFPVVVFFEGVNAWDNIHKFAILSILLSILAVTHCLSESGRVFNRRYALVAIAVGVVASAYSNMDILLNRTSADFNHFGSPDAEIAGAVGFLSSVERKGTLLPYRIDDAERCDEDGFSAIAQYSGWRLKYSYFDSFLLAPALEAESAEGAAWQDDGAAFSEAVCSMREGDMLIARAGDRRDLRRQLSEVRSCELDRVIRDYGGFLLY